MKTRLAQTLTRFCHCSRLPVIASLSLLLTNRLSLSLSPVPVEVESQVELRNVVEDRESEGGQNESEEEKEADTSFVESLVLSHVRMVTRDVVAQPYSGQGDEDEVHSIQEGPVWLDDVEEKSGEENGEK